MTPLSTEKMKHIVMTSGGICSWAAGKRVVNEHGLENTTFLFTDTIIEDDDLYRFLIETVSEIHGRKRIYHNFHLPPVEQMEERKAALAKLRKDTMVSFPQLIWMADGRTPWDVMRYERFIANSRLDPCSARLKRKLLDDWRKLNCHPEQCINYVGLDWTELHRLEKLQLHCAPWIFKAPMTEEPYLTKTKMIEMLKELGIKPPRLYAMGFPHNNCGGFCVKAGQAHFANLLKRMPGLYTWHEKQEEELRKTVGDHSILRTRKGGKSTPITLKAFRENIERSQPFDQHEWGGCGCAIDNEPKENQP